MGTQSYTLRLSSQNKPSLSREGSFQGVALGLCDKKKKKWMFRVRTPATHMQTCSNWAVHRTQTGRVMHA